MTDKQIQESFLIEETKEFEMNMSKNVDSYDAVVIGAGVAGLYQLHKLRALGMSVRVIEAASGVGGTWYWNRYPGARFDSQAEIYQYWFSKELYENWKPSERFPAQPESERWLNYVADKLDLHRDIQFETRVDSAHWNESGGTWSITTDNGDHLEARYLIACTGMLSAPLEDVFNGQSTFKGQICHTSRWPKEGVDLKNKRVAVIGTGATGIQAIQTIAPEVDTLKVFVRTPQYTIPMRNPKYTEEDWKSWSGQFTYLKDRVLNTFAGFDYDFDGRSWHSDSPEERKERLENLYNDGSLALWLSSYPEMFTDEAINEEISEFVRSKMRERLNFDPDLCDLLIPTDYGFGIRRVPLDTGYLETYLRPNVEALNCRETPIEGIVPQGVLMKDGTVHEVDVIILATGFDAGSGALTRIDIRGKEGRSLKEEWDDEIRTAMGLQVYGYPNLFTTGAPLAPSAALCNMTTCLQQQVGWITDIIQHANEEGKTVIEPTKQLQDEWVQHHDEVTNQTLLPLVDSWYMGTNVPGKPRRLLSYCGGVNDYNQRCVELAENNYPGFTFSA
ncbi:NAD(P)/FAD-dependent oxidoreductase [Marinobacter sp. UBA2678]|uniref:flavin-containing monooxygenase n=1 Tax=unclassified Marinobacter TaxID=83889 RepID=UPI0023567057|nr:NAD(P)/FAD-dependent oxidoreductase [Marinobacter sp. UBA2678]